MTSDIQQQFSWCQYGNVSISMWLILLFASSVSVSALDQHAVTYLFMINSAHCYNCVLSVQTSRTQFLVSMTFIQSNACILIYPSGMCAVYQCPPFPREMLRECWAAAPAGFTARFLVKLGHLVCSTSSSRLWGLKTCLKCICSIFSTIWKF